MVDLTQLKKTNITNDLGAMNVLIYGQPKVGKSTLASQIPNSLFLATERGHNFLEIFKQDINKWDDVLDVGKALLNQPHNFKTIVIDIADYFHKHCERYVCAKKNIEDPSDEGFGKGFKAVTDEFVKVVTRMNMAGYGMVFISHAKEKETKTKTQAWTVMGTTMSGSAEKVITGMCDVILYCYINENGDRVMRTKPTKYILAGDRTKPGLPEIMPMDYKALIKALEGATVDRTKTLTPNAQPIESAKQAVAQAQTKLKNYADDIKPKTAEA